MKKTAVSLLIISAFSQILGFSRELLLSYYYGITPIADAYQVVTALQHFVISFVITCFSLNFITYYKKANKELGNQGARNFTNNVFTLISLFLLTVVILLYFNLESIIEILGSGFNEETKLYTLNFSKIMVFSIFFCALSYMLTAYLHSREKFKTAAFIGYPMNFILMISILLSVYFNEIYLAYGFIVAYIIQFLFLLGLSYKNNFRLAFSVNLKDRYLRAMIISAFPIFLITISYEINTIIDKSIVTGVMVGGIATLTYSERLIGALYTLVVIPIITIIFPKLADLSIERNYKGISTLIRKLVMIFFVILLPICLYLLIVSYEIIEIVYGRGQFDNNAIQITSGVFAFSVIGVFFLAFRDTCLRVYYAIESYKYAIYVSIASIIINLISNILLIKVFGIKGIALATTFTMIVVSIFMLIHLQIKIRGILNKEVILKIIKIIVINLVIFIALLTIKPYLMFSSIVTIGWILLIYLFVLIIFLEFFKITKIKYLILKYIKG